MGSLLTEVRGLFSRRQLVYLMVSGKRLGDKIDIFPPKLCVIKAINNDGRGTDFVGHFLGENDDFFFPEECCRFPNLQELSVLDRPSLVC
jgi:hypothetical protein